MLETTIQSHPLLSTLVVSELNDHLGLRAEKLTVVSEQEVFIIGLKELQQIFIAQIKIDNSENVTKFIEFDFTILSSLESDHPFFIVDSPFKTIEFISDTVEIAYHSYKRNILSLLKNFFQPTLVEELSKNENIFSEQCIQIIYIASMACPELAYERLSKENNLVKRVKKEQFEQYDYLLLAITHLATEDELFEFSSKLLLDFSAREVKLGIYHGSYKAFHRFKDLFRNSGSHADLPLREKKDILKKHIEMAYQDNNDQLVILMKTLGIAADIFETGEESTETDEFYESYIAFALEQLVNYAGRKDENGLDYTAEEELHKLLASTIDNFQFMGASLVPFIIFRAYLEAKRKWNKDPLFHLADFAQKIKEYKQDPELGMATKDIALLELRFAQLNSVVGGPREFLASDFELMLLGKNEGKFCIIHTELDEQTQLDLHIRQSLAERLVFKKTTNLHQIQRGFPKVTYVIVNFGMVVSDRPHQPGVYAQHRRVFKTMPIKVSDFAVIGRSNHSGGHAEEALYTFFLNDENIIACVDAFKKFFGINMRNHKVYAIILDLHGTYDMCLSCSEKGKEFQNRFREKLLTAFQQLHLKPLTKYPTQLPIIIRYSSDRLYHYPHNEDHKKQGVPALQQSKGSRFDLGASQCNGEKQPYHYMKRNIKLFGPNFLVHSKPNMHSFWSTQRCQEHTNKFIRLESWTAFTTDSSMQYSSEDDRQFNYTLLGQVDTTLPSEVEQPSP